MPEHRAIPSLPSMLYGSVYTSIAKEQPRVPLIVSSAAQPKVFDRVLPTHRPRVHVVELQTATRITAPPMGRDIVTLPTISLEHRARHRGRAATLSVEIQAWVRVRR